MAKPPFKKGAKKPAAAAQPAAPARPPVRVRATTRAGKRALAKREPQLVEEVKATLLVCGQRVSQTVKVCAGGGRGGEGSARGANCRGLGRRPAHLAVGSIG
jgi:hypothetical protein